MAWHVIFYRDVGGNEPVKEFILAQPQGAIAEIIHVFDLLYRFGLSLGKPYIEKVRGKIWSLRIKHSSDYYRILYFAFADEKFVLLHAVKKKRDKLSKSDIELAIYRMNDHKATSIG
jgi:phage-related protein